MKLSRLLNDDEEDSSAPSPVLDHAYYTEPELSSDGREDVASLLLQLSHSHPSSTYLDYQSQTDHGNLNLNLVPSHSDRPAYPNTGYYAVNHPPTPPPPPPPPPTRQVIAALLPPKTKEDKAYPCPHPTCSFIAKGYAALIRHCAKDCYKHAAAHPSTTTTTPEFTECPVLKPDGTKCGRSFSGNNWKVNLVTHFKIHRSDQGKLWPCQFCAKSYRNQKSLLNHHKEHVGALFPCSRCDASFSSKVARDRHSNVHRVDFTGRVNADGYKVRGTGSSRALMEEHDNNNEYGLNKKLEFFNAVPQ
ncbi:hypothetical protein BCR33DRAFT_724700 [Rhizoclosmatium globosum]|uniref:C2H2-type domain-containing protein n=1 Tax=Rhizoclosmatium globosum TaxID=329046 RepID=A0A1Y2B3P6_9FUNG|nr:hypothetical protein BCR33DRAFT_724700 [Rhizoclosmatium globosum]|eukprot:ORY29452.1 hypothetical protein BCR33DRAFT_724700 [Rhizoclosmatium globosum]